MKSAREVAMHGPLDFGQRVPSHTHAQVALYFVDGVADYVGDRVRRILGAGATANAVLVMPHEVHGWRALRPETSIEHVFGDEAVQAVTA